MTDPGRRPYTCTAPTAVLTQADQSQEGKMADSDVKQKKGKKERQTAPFTTVNYVLFTVGLAMVVAGWFLLRAGSITAAPIMLVLGYCGVIPLAIVYRPRRGSRRDT